MQTIIVFDTNVLLTDPEALFAYPGAEIIIPQVVLGEIDKIKTARPDKRLRYKAREVSRILFDLSGNGSLTDGIELDNDTIIRIATYDPASIPPTLSGKNADDRILGCAWQESGRHPDREVVLVSNDLNMLLKAQTLGITVQRHEVEDNESFLSGLLATARNKRITLVWLAIPLAVALLSVTLWMFNVPSPIPASSPAFTDPATWPVLEQQYAEAVERDPRDVAVWQKLGDLYVTWGLYHQRQGQAADANDRLKRAEDSYSRILALAPRDLDARTSLASTYYYLGDVSQAISQYVQVLNIDPNHSPAHFNLASILWQHGDHRGAKREFEAYIKLAPNAPQADEARRALKAIDEALAGAGES